MIKLGWLIVGIIIGAYMQDNGIGSEYLPMAGEHAMNMVKWLGSSNRIGYSQCLDQFKLH